jgi:hypothetical protein
MRFTLPLVMSALLIAGCVSRDTKMERRLVGTWKTDDDERITFSSNGSFHYRAEKNFVVPKISRETIFRFFCDGTWKVEDGFLVGATTNSSDLPPWDSFHVKIISLGDHNMVSTDGEDIETIHR